MFGENPPGDHRSSHLHREAFGENSVLNAEPDGQNY